MLYSTDRLTYPPAFEWAVRHTLEAEGVFSNNRLDRGGKTKYGITEGLWKKVGNPAVRIEDITVEQAKDVYYRVFWKEPGLDRLQDQYIAAEVFDTAVNCGVERAVKMAQAAYNTVRRADWDAPLKEDGKLGPVSLAALHGALVAGHRPALLYAMNGEQYIHYKSQSTAQRNEFGRGWMMRLLVHPDAVRRVL
jgi:lysozyme family protein